MKQRVSALVLLSLIAGWSGVMASQGGAATSQGQVLPPPPAPPLAGDYKIGPEDVLAIVCMGQPDYSRTVPVRPDGMISLPSVNDVQAAGRTPIELRAELTKAFEKFMTVVEVSIIVMEVHSQKVSIVGQVRSPMRIEIKSRLTLIDAIAMAGGFTEYAKKDRIFVQRLDGTRHVFNFDKYVERQESSPENIQLRGGDIIIVPS